MLQHHYRRALYNNLLWLCALSMMKCRNSNFKVHFGAADDSAILLVKMTRYHTGMSYVYLLDKCIQDMWRVTPMQERVNARKSECKKEWIILTCHLHTWDSSADFNWLLNPRYTFTGSSGTSPAFFLRRCTLFTTSLQSPSSANESSCLNSRMAINCPSVAASKSAAFSPSGALNSFSTYTINVKI